MQRQRLPCQPTSQTWFMSTSKACGQFAQKVLIGPTPITRVGVNEVHCKLIHDKILDSHLVQPLQVAQYFLIPPTHLLKTLNTNKTPSKVLYKLHHMFSPTNWATPLYFSSSLHNIPSDRDLMWHIIPPPLRDLFVSGSSPAAHSPKGLRMDGKCLVNVPCAQTTQALVVQFPSQTRRRCPSKIFHPRLRRPAKTRLVDVPGTTSQLDLNESNVLDVNTCGPIWWKPWWPWWVLGMMGEDWVKGQWPWNLQINNHPNINQTKNSCCNRHFFWGFSHLWFPVYPILHHKLFSCKKVGTKRLQLVFWTIDSNDAVRAPLCSHTSTTT